jgi:hypothetical protein
MNLYQNMGEGISGFIKREQFVNDVLCVQSNEMNCCHSFAI